MQLQESQAAGLNGKQSKEETVMSQNVLITGTGRPYALGFNLVRRYLEQGDHVLATVRKPSEALEELRKSCPGTLPILTNGYRQHAVGECSGGRSGRACARS